MIRKYCANAVVHANPAVRIVGLINESILSFECVPLDQWSLVR
jgi:hypothetical protein